MTRELELLRDIHTAESQLASGSAVPHAEARSKVRAALAELRAPSGRLSAKRIAALFGLGLAELARLLGKTKQAVSKTEDSEAIQEGLTELARIARLRAVLSADDFRAWLNLPNESLEGRRPISLIRDGEAAVIADLVADMLSGSPG